MNDYELRFFDAHDRLSRTQQLACEGDDAAIDRAAFLNHGWRSELWQGERLVWRFEHHPPNRR